MSRRDNLLALRVALINSVLSGDVAEAVVNYRTPVPLFHSGVEAADHGRGRIEIPSEAAPAGDAKLKRLRPELLD